MDKYPNLSAAIKKAFEAETDAFLAQLDPDPGFTLSDKVERKIKRLAKRRDKSYYPLICTVGRRVACVMAIIVVFAVSAMSIKPVRAAVAGFFTEEFSTHTHMTTTHDTLPVNSTNLVEIDFTVPEGFELINKKSTDVSIIRKYTNGDRYIVYEQILKEHFSANYDNERTITENYIDENGQEYIIMNHDDIAYTVIWKNSDYVYSINSNLTKSEILDLCKQTNLAE